ncbi:hypothetical protein Shyhy01_05440 [Streptomyces hygroscopicus subsp. hygroscopicus]|nr:hypothetical protein Shyhy01_05440 [Streptomyces hygroscopicus subsp. hygroscopicus]
MGWGAALAEGAASRAVAAAAAVATTIAADCLARVGPNMSLLSGVAPVGGSHGWGWCWVVGGGSDPLYPGERYAHYARSRNLRLPMREPPRGSGEGKPSVRFS